MWRVRFWEVDGEDVNADGGFIEVDDDGLVTLSKQLDWAADLLAPTDPKDFQSASSRPAGGFEEIGVEGDRVVFKAVGAWDPEVWIDKVRYHFRTPYLRPGEVEGGEEPEPGGVRDATDGSSGLLDLHVDVDQPNDDWVDPVDYWWATGEGWDDIPESDQDDILRSLGLTQGRRRPDGEPPGLKAE